MDMALTSDGLARYQVAEGAWHGDYPADLQTAVFSGQQMVAGRSGADFQTFSLEFMGFERGGFATIDDAKAAGWKFAADVLSRLYYLALKKITYGPHDAPTATPDSEVTDLFRHAHQNAKPGCCKCHGTGQVKIDRDRTTICASCCRHDLGWTRLRGDGYGSNNGKWCCNAGCGQVSDVEPVSAT
jgi:hypothetical protein